MNLLTKKILFGAVATVLLGGGGYLFLGNNDTSPSDSSTQNTPSVSKKILINNDGTVVIAQQKPPSRDLVAEAFTLCEKVGQNSLAYRGTNWHPKQNKKIGDNFEYEVSDRSELFFKYLPAYEKAGLVTITNTRTGVLKAFINFTLTDKGKLYASEKEHDFSTMMAHLKDTKSLELYLNEVDQIEVTGLTSPSENYSGEKTMSVEYTIKFKPTPFGQISPTEEGILEKSKGGRLKLWDDGWRVNCELFSLGI